MACTPALRHVSLRTAVWGLRHRAHWGMGQDSLSPRGASLLAFLLPVLGEILIPGSEEGQGM